MSDGVKKLKISLRFERFRTHIASWGEEEVPYCSSIHLSNFNVTPAQKSDLDPVWPRLLAASQLSNPSDLPCPFFYMTHYISFSPGEPMA